MVRVSRGDRVSIFSDFDRGEVEFLRGSILVDFRYIRVKIVTIRRRASIFSRATRFVVVLPPPGRAARFFISAFVATALIMATLGNQWFQNSPEARKTGISDATKISGAQSSSSRSQLTLLVPESPRMYALARQVVRPQLQAVKATHSGLSLNRLARKCETPTPKSEIPLFPASWRPL